MVMENSRRSFDRSREQGIKKPRLTDELERGPNPSVRPLTQRQVASGVNTLASARFRPNDRDSGSSDSARGPQQTPHQELVTQYRTALAELTFNSKPIITNLTIIAGENVYAAKAIAGTVCVNILEVPSEQKLPSLYLLDSIVKNIGRDYIKYFAARLPEVFCKAYRQVDPSVHSSMRHLFGTWKGVFPLQTLQMIEKELGFTRAANGSSSASTTPRIDSQSQRPPHSIHVNPKYLERQRLQQSSRTKGTANNMTGAIANSTEETERPDRTLVAARPWVNPSVNMHNISRAHRDAINDSLPEKSNSASYGGNEHGSDLSSKLGLGVGRTGGRVTDLGHDKAWYKTGSDVTEVKPGQRNGLSLKHGFSNPEAPKSLNLDAHHQPTQSLTSIRSSVMSSSWKNSEEEEFTWDDMDSGLTDYDASNISNNLSKDHWTADDENLAVEDHLQITECFGAKVDREIFTESLSSGKKQLPSFGHRPSLSWQLQEQHSIEEPNCNPVHGEASVSTLGGLPASTNSSAVRMGNWAFLPNATIGSAGRGGQQNFHTVQAESPSGHSPLRQQSPSPPVTVPLPHHLQNLAEQDHRQTPKTSQFSGDLPSHYIQDSSPALPPNIQVGHARKSQQRDLQGAVPTVTSFQPRHRTAVSQQQQQQQQQLGSSHTEVSDETKKLPQSKVSLVRETSDQSTPSSLLAAVVKSGIFNSSITSNLPTTSFLDTRNLPSQLGPQPIQTGGPQGKVASPSSLSPPDDDSSTPIKISQGKVGQPPRASTLPPASSIVSSASTQTSNSTSNTSSPISNLLNSLVAKGLISAKTESSTKVPADRLEDQSHSITTSSSSPVASVSGSPGLPVSSLGDEVDHDVNSSVSLSQSTPTEIRNLIGFEFKPDIIRQLHPPVIRELLDDLPHCCSNCGLRLKHQEQFNRHLKWHVTREREQNGLIRASRRWYAKSSDWMTGKAEYPSEYEFTDSVDAYSKKEDKSELDAMVSADENQCLCMICGELFEDFYCQERDEWMFKGAVYLTNPGSDGEMLIRNVKTARGPIIHAKCLSETSISSVTKMERD